MHEIILLINYRMVSSQKTVILLCGLTRDCRHAAATFKKFFADISYDVFLHTWELAEDACSPNSNAGIKLDKLSHSKDELIELFGLTKIKKDNLDLELVATLKRGHSVDDAGVRSLCRYESMRRVFELANNCSDYDRVIITRPDVVYLDGLAKFILPNSTEEVVATPTLPNMRTGKRLLIKMEKDNPNAECDWMHEFFAVCTPKSTSIIVDFGNAYLDVLKRFPLPSDPWHVDRALALYLKRDHALKIVEFNMKHGLQRDGWIQNYY